MKPDAVAELLKGNDFFSALSADCVAFLSANASQRYLATGQVLFQQGQPADHFFIMQSGSVAVEVPAIAGPPLQVQNLGPGQVLGWSWLIPPYRWDFQARGTADAELIQFDAVKVREHCDADPAFGYALLKAFTALMSERLHAARRVMIRQWMPAGFA